MKRYMQEKGDSYPWRTGREYLSYNDTGYRYGALLCICKEDGSNTGGVSKKSRNSDKEASWNEGKIKKYSRNEKYI